MTITVSKQEFCERVAELLTLLEGGAEVVVQRPGQPELKVTAGQPTPEGEKPRREWVFDMHPGAFIAPDFADPLPNEYWQEESCDTKAKRIPGLHTGRGWMSDDFDEPIYFE